MNIVEIIRYNKNGDKLRFGVVIDIVAKTFDIDDIAITYNGKSEEIYFMHEIKNGINYHKLDWKSQEIYRYTRFAEIAGGKEVLEDVIDEAYRKVICK